MVLTIGYSQINLAKDAIVDQQIDPIVPIAPATEAAGRIASP